VANAGAPTRAVTRMATASDAVLARVPIGMAEQPKPCACAAPVVGYPAVLPSTCVRFCPVGRGQIARARRITGMIRLPTWLG
jgi:hypothetical protein